MYFLLEHPIYTYTQTHAHTKNVLRRSRNGGRRNGLACTCWRAKNSFHRLTPGIRNGVLTCQTVSRLTRCNGDIVSLTSLHPFTIINIAIAMRRGSRDAAPKVVCPDYRGVRVNRADPLIDLRTTPSRF